MSAPTFEALAEAQALRRKAEEVIASGRIQVEVDAALYRLRADLFRANGNLAYAEVEIADALRYAEGEGVTSTPVADRTDLKRAERLSRAARELVLEVIDRTRTDSPENGRKGRSTGSTGDERGP